MVQAQRVPELVGGGARGERDPDLGFAQLDRTWGRVAAAPSPIVAVREGRYRLIHDVREPERDELYDLTADPGEFEDIAQRAPEIARRMAARARRCRHAAPHAPAGGVRACGGWCRKAVPAAGTRLRRSCGAGGRTSRGEVVARGRRRREPLPYMATCRL